jgi:hypothetical protein
MKQVGLFLCFLLVDNLVKAQVLVGATGQTPHPSAAFEIRTNNLGLLLPRLTRLEIIAIANPAEGLVVYNTTNKQPAFFDGISWRYFSNSLMTYPGSGVNSTEATTRINFYRASGYRGIAAAPPVQWNDTLAYAMYKFAENKVLLPTGSAYYDNNNVSIFQYPSTYGYTRTTSNAARAIADPSGYTVSQVIDLWMNDADISYAQALMGTSHKNFGIGRYQSTWYIILGQ